jgi:hypothetical protein
MPRAGYAYAFADLEFAFADLEFAFADLEFAFAISVKNHKLRRLGGGTKPKIFAGGFHYVPPNLRLSLTKN